LLVIGVVGSLLFVTFVRYTSYSNGYRAGEIIKFSRKGYVFKTFEGEMNLGGFVRSEQEEITPTIWAFSVYRGDDDVRSKIIQAMENGYRVRLYYKERFFKLFWYGDTKYFIDKVELVE
jgi:hypothetical protein